MKLFYGLWGIADDGTLFTPSGKRILRLPSWLGWRVKDFLDSLSYIGKKAS